MFSLLALTLLAPADAAPESTSWVAPVQTEDAAVVVSLDLVGDALQYRVQAQGGPAIERAFVRSTADAEQPLLVLEPGANGLAGSVSADALRGDLTDDSLADLAAALDSGEAVVTLHVDGLPAGSVLARVEAMSPRLDQRQALFDD